MYRLKNLIFKLINGFKIDKDKLTIRYLQGVQNVFKPAGGINAISGIAMVISIFLLNTVGCERRSELTQEAVETYRESQVGKEEIVQAFQKAGLSVFRERVESIDFSLPLLSGGIVKLSDFRGKIVFLNFWATWCPPCRAEMPSMEELYQHFKDQGLEILAVDIQESPSQVSAFMKEYKLSFPALLDSTGSVSSRYGVRGIPTTFIIDREGFVILSVTGGLNWSSPNMIQAFEVLLKHGL